MARRAGTDRPDMAMAVMNGGIATIVEIAGGIAGTSGVGIAGTTGTIDAGIAGTIGMIDGTTAATIVAEEIITGGRSKRITLRIRGLE